MGRRCQGVVGDVGALSLWAGQSVGLVKDVRPAGQIVRSISDQADAIFREMAR